jgi:hypothetical protein
MIGTIGREKDIQLSRATISLQYPPFVHQEHFIAEWVSGIDGAQRPHRRSEGAPFAATLTNCAIDG